MNNAHAYEGEELEIFSHAKNWKKYFSSFITPYIKGDVLEAGAGTGNNTSYLQNNTASSWLLLEPDQHFCNILQETINKGKLPQKCCVKQGTIFSLTAAETYDTIIYIDVLEHIEHDKEEIQQAIRLLRSGGHIIILSPAHNFLYSRFDKVIGHFRRYNKRSLISVVDGVAINKIRLHYLDSLGGFLSLGNKLLMKQSYPTLKQVLFWDKLVLPASTFADKLLCYNLGKTILGVWKKP